MMRCPTLTTPSLFSKGAHMHLVNGASDMSARVAAKQIRQEINKSSEDTNMDGSEQEGVTENIITHKKKLMAQMDAAKNQTITK
eukprot:15341418-Ditylum_brightwellii.AAC.1